MPHKSHRPDDDEEAQKLENFRARHAKFLTRVPNEMQRLAEMGLEVKKRNWRRRESARREAIRNSRPIREHAYRQSRRRQRSRPRSPPLSHTPRSPRGTVEDPIVLTSSDEHGVGRAKKRHRVK